MKTILQTVLVGLGLGLLASCAPSTIAPAPVGSGYSTSVPVFLSTPVSARVSKPGVTSLGIKADSIGLGFEVTDGPLGFELKVPPRSGVFARGSYVQDRLMASLSLGWETYDRYGGYPNYTRQAVSSGGIALDLGYFFQIPLETAQGYAGPRLYTYFLCESVDNSPLSCVGPRFNPGLTIGVNLKLGERFTISPEISALLLPPDEYYTTPRGATLFSVSLSYRF